MATAETGILPKSDNLRKLKGFDTLSKLRQGYTVTDIERETLHSLASGAEAEAKSVDTEIARLRALVLELEKLRKSGGLHKLAEPDTFSKLLQGHTVTEVEKGTLHSLASGAEAEAKLVDTEIARLRALILELEYSRESLLKAARQARSLVAPIRKLPPEILGEIFCLAHSCINFFHSRFHAMLAVPIGNICWSWHNIAIGTPKLWSCITITMKRGLPPRALQRLEEILELSGNVLLDLTVETSEWPASSKQMASSAAFPVIHKHSQRCKHLTLDGHIHFVLQFFRIGPSPHSFNSESGTLSPQLPSLRSLELDIVADEDPGPGHALMVLHIPSASAQNLRNLSIMNTYNYQGGLASDLPWRQLDTLMFGVRHLSEFFDALSNATSLT
jgi:hypothetical protein